MPEWMNCAKLAIICHIYETLLYENVGLAVVDVVIIKILNSRIHTIVGTAIFFDSLKKTMIFIDIEWWRMNIKQN